MKTVMAFVRQHPAPTYFALTFALSWGAVLLVIGGPGGIAGTAEQSQRLLPWAIVAMLVGPTVASLLMTGLTRGGAGYRELLSRALTWRVGARWYALALLTAPVLMTVGLWALSRTSSAFVPGLFATQDKAGLLLFGLLAGLGAGIFEELGWTGFATPALRLRHGVVRTGLVVGVLWGAWHLLTNVFWASGTTAGAVPLGLFLTARTIGFLVGELPAYRVLMVWVYERTGSLLVAILMHVSLTASTLILGPLAISGAPLLICDLVMSLALWAVVGVVALVEHGRFSLQPLQRRMA